MPPWLAVVVRAALLVVGVFIELSDDERSMQIFVFYYFLFLIFYFIFAFYFSLFIFAFYF
jgi:hypothetical protein